GGDAHRHVLNVLRTLLRGDDDFLDARSGRGGVLRIRRRLRERARLSECQSERDGGQCDCSDAFAFHLVISPTVTIQYDGTGYLVHLYSIISATMKDAVRSMPCGSVLLALALLAPGAHAAAAQWDVTRTYGVTRSVDFFTDEGTDMSVDVSPDGRWIVLDLI